MLVASILIGVILFSFIFIASKRSGKYYMAPIGTFLAAGIVTLYGLFFVGGFEGMAYGLIGLVFLSVAILGTLLLPLLLRKNHEKKPFSKKDKWSLFLLPLAMILIIGSMIVSNKTYWVIEEGTRAMSDSEYQGYMESTILEGRKMLDIRLGKGYEGKRIQVEKVKQIGSTTVVLRIEEGGTPNELPYIKIGIDQIKKPLVVETTDGSPIGPFGKQ